MSACCLQQTGAHRPDPTKVKGLAIMEFLPFAVFILLALASMFGWTADSRDGADWAPTVNGQRATRSL
jgi:hypothetical protein